MKLGKIDSHDTLVFDPAGIVKQIRIFVRLSCAMDKRFWKNPMRVPSMACGVIDEMRVNVILC
jgi:hypothetical protein